MTTCTKVCWFYTTTITHEIMYELLAPWKYFCVFPSKCYLFGLASCYHFTGFKIVSAGSMPFGRLLSTVRTLTMWKRVWQVGGVSGSKLYIKLLLSADQGYRIQHARISVPSAKVNHYFLTVAELSKCIFLNIVKVFNQLLLKSV